MKPATPHHLVETIFDDSIIKDSIWARRNQGASAPNCYDTGPPPRGESFLGVPLELPDGQLETVATACAVAGTTLWLCEEEPCGAYAAMREAWPTVPSTIEELLAALPHPTRSVASPAADYPDVPLDGHPDVESSLHHPSSAPAD